MSRPVIKLLVGGQNAGKSTWLRQHFEDVPGKPDIGRHFVQRGGIEWVVLSRDRVRETYAQQKGIAYQDSFAKAHNDAVNVRFFHLLDACIAEGDNIMIDNTNMRVEDRKQILDHVAGQERGQHYYTEALIFPLDVEAAIARNAARDAKWKEQGKPERQIPESVIRDTYDSYVEPSTKEGFNKVKTVHTQQVRGAGGTGLAH